MEELEFIYLRLLRLDSLDMSTATFGRLLIDDFIHILIQDESEQCLQFFGSMHELLIEGPVENKPTELRETLSKLFSSATTDSETLKRIPDAIFVAFIRFGKKRPKSLSKQWKFPAGLLSVRFHIEHQHRNDSTMPYRMLVYLGMMGLKDDELPTIQFVVYTGDVEFDSKLPQYGPIHSIFPLIIDLTQIDPKIVMEHSSVHIRILTIFNHRD